MKTNIDGVPEIAKIAEEMYKAGRRLEGAADGLYTLAADLAKAEKEYREALAIKIIEIKDKERATLVPDLARGDKEVVSLKYKRDLAEFRYKAGRDSVEAIRSQLSALQTIYNRQTEV